MSILNAISVYFDSLDLNKTKEFDGSSRILLDRLVTESLLHLTFVPGYSIYDSFTGVAGALAGHSPEIGGTWTDVGSSFVLDGSGSVVSQGATGVNIADNAVDTNLYAQSVPEFWFETTIGPTGAGNYGLVFQKSKTTQEAYWVRISPSTGLSSWNLFNGIIFNSRNSSGADEGTVSNQYSDVTARANGDWRFGVTLLGTSVVLWLEPAGGGIRTTLATWNGNTFPPLVSRLDSDHSRVGIIWQSSATLPNWSTLGAPDEFMVGHTVATLPYAVPLDGSEGTLVVLDRSTGLPVAFTQTDAVTLQFTGDLSTAHLWIGIQYDSSVTLSTIYERDQNGAAKSTGRLQLGYLDVDYKDTRGLSVRVTPLERTARSTALDVAVAEEGTLHVPVLTRNETALIELLSVAHKDFRVFGLKWEGERSNTRYTRGKVT